MLIGQVRCQKWSMTVKSFESNSHIGKFHGEREVMIFKSLLGAEGRVCKSCYKPGFQVNRSIHFDYQPKWT